MRDGGTEAGLRVSPVVGGAPGVVGNEQLTPGLWVEVGFEGRKSLNLLDFGTQGP